MPVQGKLIVWILCLALLLCACAEQQPQRISGKAFGTSYSLVIAEADPPELEPLKQAVDARLKAIDASMSSWREDSELSRFQRQPVGKWVEISPGLAGVFFRSRLVYQRTRGAFDPSLGPLIRLWGFQGEKRANPPPADEVTAALARIGFDSLELRGNHARRTRPIEINLSAIAKGYAVDALAILLREEDIDNFLVEIGGELVTSGSRFDEPWRVAIEAPSNTGREPQRLLYLREGALATSGSYRNYFESGGKRYQHILDPKTGYPADNGVVSVSVLARDCATADAYATAFMLLGKKSLPLAQRQGLEVLILLEENGELTSLASEGFPKPVE